MNGVRSTIGVLAATIALMAGPAVGQEFSEDVYVLDERVYANLSTAPIVDQLWQLAEAASIELVLTNNIQGNTDLHAKGQPLARVVDKMLPDGSGYALQMDADQKVVRLIVFSNDSSDTPHAAGNERQHYLARQMGKRDDSTADIMYETLSNRGLDDTQAKLIAIEQLVDIKSQHAGERLLAGMGDHDPRVRLATAQALYRLQGDKAITLIGQIYYAETSGPTRKQVAAVVSGSSHPLALGIAKESAGRESGPSRGHANPY